MKLVGAETYYQAREYKFDKFDKNTGQRNLIMEYSCSAKHWWNNHDKYASGELIKSNDL